MMVSKELFSKSSESFSVERIFLIFSAGTENSSRGSKDFIEKESSDFNFYEY